MKPQNQTIGSEEVQSLGSPFDDLRALEALEDAKDKLTFWRVYAIGMTILFAVVMGIVTIYG